VQLVCSIDGLVVTPPQSLSDPEVLRGHLLYMRSVEPLCYYSGAITYPVPCTGGDLPYLRVIDAPRYYSGAITFPIGGLGGPVGLGGLVSGLAIGPTQSHYLFHAWYTISLVSVYMMSLVITPSQSLYHWDRMWRWRSPD